MTVKFPCRDCTTDRKPNCHAHCKKYIEAVELRRIEREQRMQESYGFFKSVAHERNIRKSALRKKGR